MKILLTGATGYIGGAVAEALQAAGHTVAGLARSVEAEQTIKARGLTPIRGDLNSPHSLAEGIGASDGVIHAGTTNDGRVDGDAIHTMIDALKGSQKPLLYTSGVWVLGNTGETPADESAPVRPIPIVAWRPSVEREVLESHSQGIRGIVIRPVIVYGRGEGLAGMFVQSANETGAARYIGDGQNRWSVVHVEDLADLYVRALEKAKPGSLYHGAGGSAFRTQEIAEAASFGADAGGLTESWTVEDAREKLGGYLVEALMLDQVVSGDKARRELGWEPAAISLLEDLRYGSYAMTRINP